MEMSDLRSDSKVPAIDDETGTDERKTRKKDLLYGVNERPPIFLSLLLGFQQYMTLYGGVIAYPYVLMPKLCIRDDDPVRGYILSTGFFASGLATFLQATVGVRLPLVQASAFTFLLPILTLLQLPEYTCPTTTANMTSSEYEEVWKSRMNEIQGGIIIAGVTEALIGFSGIIGYLLKWITPLVIVPTITQVGLSMFRVCSREAGESWPFAIFTIATMTLFSQYLTNVYIPVPSTKKEEQKRTYRKFYIFKQFPVLMTISVVWFVAFVCTLADWLPKGHPGRTDGEKSNVFHTSDWFRVPYPFQWGLPRFAIAAAIGVLCGTFVSIFESVGDYYACARLCEAPPPPKNAVNRGICMEGIGCVLSGIFGSGAAVTSYSENIGAISITKVGSRRVIQAAALVMMTLSIFVKLCAVFTTIPTPIMGGILIIMSSIICAVGISTLRFVDLSSSRNLFVLGTSIFIGLCVPKWLMDNPTAIHTGSINADQLLKVLLGNAMFVSGTIGFLLDNTLPGTAEERGLHKWLKVKSETENEYEDNDKTYKIPSWFPRSSKCCRVLPICPSRR